MTSGFEKIRIDLPAGKKIYFSSDYHLGVPDYKRSLEREKLIIQWLESIEHDAHAIFLVGDIFDFWFEYGHVVPKGFVRLLGKLATMADSGVQLHLFTGNHDMWMFGYLEQELGARMYRQPAEFEVNSAGASQLLLVGHGDGLGPGDNFYKFLKKVFANRFFQWLFGVVHPDVGIWIAHQWSVRSRIANTKKGEERFLGEEHEWLYIYSNEVETVSHHDFYIFGHRHLPLDMRVGSRSRYINIGEWVTQQMYAVFDGLELKLLPFRP